MNDVMRLLKDETVAKKLRKATRRTDAARIIVLAGKAKGITLTISGVSAILKAAPRKDPKKVTKADLASLGAIKTTLETKLTQCSKICCYTCRTSQIVW